jgi:hypothetical protein
VAPLSQWLELMLGEIVRKREELAHAQSEQARRELEHTREPSGERAGSEAAPERAQPGAAAERPRR